MPLPGPSTNRKRKKIDNGYNGSAQNPTKRFAPALEEVAPIRCTECLGNIVLEECALKKHFRLKHFEYFPFQCKLCDEAKYATTTKEDMWKHYRDVHKANNFWDINMSKNPEIEAKIKTAVEKCRGLPNAMEPLCQASDEDTDLGFRQLHQPTTAMSAKAGKRKDPNQPKRHMPAYILWFKAIRSRIAEPGMSSADVARAAGVKWNALKRKSVWERAAARDKLRYQREMAVYNWK